MSRQFRDQKWSDRIDLEGLARFLRELYPDKTAENVGADTGTPPNTVRKWLLGVARPGCIALLKLVCCYGPEVLTAMLRDPPDWLDALARQHEQARYRARNERRPAPRRAA